MIPYQVDVPMQRWPYANWLIIGAIVLFHVLSPVKLDQHIIRELMGKEPSMPTTVLSAEHFKLWQPITTTFIHAGFWHTAGNLVFLFVFGNAVNAKIGHLPYVVLYLLFAYLSGIAWYVLPGGGLYMVGASGAIMGIAGMFLLYYPVNEVSIVTWLVFRPFVFHMRSFWLLIFYFVLDVLGVFSGGGGVANIAHVAGFAAGAGVAYWLIRTGITRPSRGERSFPEVLGMTVARENPQ